MVTFILSPGLHREAKPACRQSGYSGNFPSAAGSAGVFFLLRVAHVRGELPRRGLKIAPANLPQNT
jgi:hypothetical protein